MGASKSNSADADVVALLARCCRLRRACELGGLPSWRRPRRLQHAHLVDHVRNRFTVVAATIAAYTPSNDDGSTLSIAMAGFDV